MKQCTSISSAGKTWGGAHRVVAMYGLLVNGRVLVMSSGKNC